MTEGRALTRLVVLDGEVWEAGSVPPPEVAKRIRNPKCWAPFELDPPLPWGPEGMPAINTADQPVIPAAPATNGIHNLEEQAGGTEQSGVIAAQSGYVISRDPAEPLAPPAQPAEFQEPVVAAEPQPEQAAVELTPGPEPVIEATPEPEPVAEQPPIALLPEPPRSGRGASESAWRAYAEQLGVDVPPDADRGQIIAQLKDDGHIQ